MIVNVTDSDAGLYTCVDWDVYVLKPDINAYDVVVMSKLDERIDFLVSITVTESARTW